MERHGQETFAFPRSRPTASGLARGCPQRPNGKMPREESERSLLPRCLMRWCVKKGAKVVGFWVVGFVGVCLKERGHPNSANLDFRLQADCAKVPLSLGFCRASPRGKASLFLCFLVLDILW